MKTIRYKSWNWELDRGEDSSPSIMLSADNKGNCYAEAYFDDRGYIFRVKEFSDSGNTIYDYYCDDNGKIIEKRNYTDDGELFVIVRYSYDNETNEVSESAWYPKTNETATCKRSVK